MAAYGAVYRGDPTAVGYRNPLAGRTFGIPQQDYFREFPSALNSWYLGQFPESGQGALAPRYQGFLNQWLGDQLSLYEGAQVDNPDLSYPSYLASRNPWEAYQQSLAPAYSRAQRSSIIGPRWLRR